MMTTRFYAAGHALIKRDQVFLVTRRSALNDYKPLLWDVPGGTVDPGETVEEAVRREVLEETGLHVRVGRVIHVYTNTSQLPERQTFQMVYLCEYVDGEVVLNPVEHDAHRWIAASGIEALDTIPFLADLVRGEGFGAVWE